MKMLGTNNIFVKYWRYLEMLLNPPEIIAVFYWFCVMVTKCIYIICSEEWNEFVVDKYSKTKSNSHIENSSVSSCPWQEHPRPTISSQIMFSSSCCGTLRWHSMAKLTWYQIAGRHQEHPLPSAGHRENSTELFITRCAGALRWYSWGNGGYNMITLSLHFSIFRNAQQCVHTLWQQRWEYILPWLK